jgi:DNA polymerase-1
MSDELFLIDGNSLAYRAFFALPESIATSTGVPTNAIFGFASMLVKILTEYGPKATVVVWDGGYTGRKELYPEYKAQRSSRPDLLKEQWPHLEPLVDAFGYANLRIEGYEADDVIASLAAKAAQHDPKIPVMVVTGDRDAYQLVDDSTRIMTTSRGITDTKVYDIQGVIDRYGITPEQVPDFIGLKGDTSDNIPGVPGIGDKTAAELLQRFQTVENVLENIDTPTTRGCPSSSPRPSATSRSTSTSGPTSARTPTARSSATPSASSSSATRCGASRRRSARLTPPRRRRKPRPDRN